MRGSGCGRVRTPLGGVEASLETSELGLRVVVVAPAATDAVELRADLAGVDVAARSARVARIETRLPATERKPSSTAASQVSPLGGLDLDDPGLERATAPACGWPGCRSRHRRCGR